MRERLFKENIRRNGTLVQRGGRNRVKNERWIEDKETGRRGEAEGGRCLFVGGGGRGFWYEQECFE